MAKITPPTPVNTPNPRTLSSILLRTFALRMAVFTTYGHLGTLQNLSSSSTNSIPRMLVLIFLPVVTLISFATGYLASLLEVPHWKRCLMTAAGLHVPCRSPISHQVISVTKVPVDKLKHTPPNWTWDAVWLLASRVVVLFVILAQAVASLILIIRRRDIDGSTLMLDSINGVYALVGICAVFNSTLIIAVGGEWESIQEPLEAKAIATKPISWVYDYFWFSIVPVAYLRGQPLLYPNCDESLHWYFR